MFEPLTEVGTEDGAQRVQAAVQVLLDRTLRDPHRPGHLRLAEVGEVAESDDLALASRQRPHGRGQRQPRRGDVLEGGGRRGRRQREVVALRYLADLSEAEVAGAMRISEGSVKQHLHRGLHSLRAILGPDLSEGLEHV